MTWDQILQLQNTYGWEIGSHTVTHQCLVSVGDDCQATKLTAAQVDAELANSKAALAARGINATAFAPPYGDYDMSAVAQVAKYYSSMRGFADTGNNIWPLGDYLLRNVPVQEVTTPVATLKAKVDEAIANKNWVVFTFHDIRPNPSRNPDDYQYGTAELDQLAAYVKTKVAAGQIKNVNCQQGPGDRQPQQDAEPHVQQRPRGRLADRRPGDDHRRHGEQRQLPRLRQVGEARLRHRARVTCSRRGSRSPRGPTTCTRPSSTSLR